MSALDALVVGGGISGLATAHGLARAGLDVELWEGALRVGGKIHTVERDGYLLESAATMVVNFRGALDGFLRGAQLDTKRRGRGPVSARYVLDADRLVAAPTGVGELLRTRLLSGGAKLRMLAEPFAPRGRDRHESVAAFVTRRLGRELLDKLFDPYVAGPLASDAALAEARATLPRLVALEKRYGSLALGALCARLAGRGSAARPEVFSFSGGMATLTEHLACEGGFRVRRGVPVREAWPERGGWRVRGGPADAPRDTSCRHLVVSAPPQAAAEILRDVDAALARLLASVRFAPIKVVHTGFERSRIGHALNGSGFLVPSGSAFAANGCLWVSRLFSGCAPQDRVLLTSYLGGSRNPGAAAWDDARSSGEVMRMLHALLAARGEPDVLHVETHERALPLYHGAYSATLAAMDERLGHLPGLHLEGNYRGGVSVRDRVACAQSAAARIARQITAARRPRGANPGLSGAAVPAAQAALPIP
ncbi:MAG: protoporphyrinogen oxidase [Betaproteobacteria bacterium]|nr:protoporphyrinogen oxidase [Betaproteobacteria bacterium]